MSHFRKNPVVLWAHDYNQLPVAKATNLSITEQGLAADIQFPPRGVYPFADTVHDMLKAGFLSATSVGFKPSEHEENADRSKNGRSGFDFKKQELLEFSIVPVPSNPEALVTQRHAQVDQAVVKQWCAQITEWASKTEASLAETVEADVLDFSDTFDDEDGFEIVTVQKADHLEIDDQKFKDLMRACIGEAVAGAIQGHVTQTINRLRGRVD
jgi:HK97 family phage prohead protease